MSLFRSKGIIYISVASVVVFAFTFIGFVLADDSGTKPLPLMYKIGKLQTYIEPDVAKIDEFHRNMGDRGLNPVSLSNVDDHYKDEAIPKRRIFLFGDIHGRYDAIKSFKHITKYNQKYDQLVFLGDFISKGDDNFEILDFAIENNVACVLGNHELNILLLYSDYFRHPLPQFCTVDEKLNNSSDSSKETSDAEGMHKSKVVCSQLETPDISLVKTPKEIKHDPELAIAKRLKPRHIDYLSNCSIILNLGPVGYGPNEKKKKKDKKEKKNTASEESQTIGNVNVIQIDKKHQQAVLNPSRDPHTSQFGSDINIIDYDGDENQEKPMNFIPGESRTIASNGNLNLSTPIEGIAVHAGLQWHLNLTSQTVDVATNIRGLWKPDYKEPSYLSKNEVDKSKVKPWSKVWDKKQKEISNWEDRRIVFYGHESSRGVIQRDYTVGLDGGYVKGGELGIVQIEGAWIYFNGEGKSEERKLVYHNTLFKLVG